MLDTGQGVHAETAVAGTARMAGTFLFRSFGLALEDVQPGQVVLSDMANEQGPVLIEILGAVLSQSGVLLEEANLGGASDHEHRPLRTFLETQRQLEPGYSDIRKHYGLTLREASEACAVATGLLIEDSSTILDPTIGFNIAVYAFVEGTKTAPDPVA